MSIEPVVAAVLGMLVGLFAGIVIVIRINRGIGPEW